MIRFLTHEQIDRKKWDDCLEGAPNYMIYASSWYLDIISPGWYALVEDDYLRIMPLPVRNKFGIAYIFTPYYAQQLGVFGQNISPEIIEDFIRYIPARYRLIDMNLNEQNPLPEKYDNFPVRNNYLLSLEGDYESIQKKYNRNGRRNLKKAREAGLELSDPVSAKDFARFIRNNLEDQMRGLDNYAIGLLESVTQACLDRGKAEILTIRDRDGEIAALGSFLLSGKRIIFSVCASTSEGKQKQAMHFLVDAQIRKAAGKFELFDFSGSNIRGIAYFNSTFGAEQKTYPLVHINRLSWLHRLISGKFR